MELKIERGVEILGFLNSFNLPDIFYFLSKKGEKIMRDIKFRLIKDRKIVGWELHKQETHFFQDLEIIKHSKDNKNWENILHMGKWVSYILHNIKEQYIGKTDSEGIEICEGDIMEFYSAMVEKGTNPIKRVVVKWNKKYLRFENCFNGGKIIGNIHENKNLIEK